MLELVIPLEFECCRCEQTVGVTVKCEGEGLAEADAKAMFKILCPHCEQENYVIFAPRDGRIVDVTPEVEIVRYVIPQPSVN